MFPFRYLRHVHVLVLIHVGARPLASALAVGGAVQQEALLAPVAGAAPPRPAGGPVDPKSWERAVLSPEGDEPLLRPKPEGTEPAHYAPRADISAISHPGDDARGRAAPEKIIGIPTALAVLMVVAAAVNAMLCCALRGPRTEGLPQREYRPAAEWPRAKGSISSLGGSMVSAVRSRQRAWHPAAGAAAAAPRGRRGSGHGSGSSEIESQVTIEDSSPSMMTDQMPIMEAKDIVLCPLLVVPANNRCVCLVSMSATNEKQDVVIPVRGVGGANLFRIRMNESGAGGPRIQVETVDGNALAYVSTEPLWRAGGRPPPPEGARSPGPVLRICWPSGRPFGCLRKAGNRAWAVQVDGREQDVLSFVGDLRGGSVNVNTLSMQAVASTSHVSGRDYRATVRAHCDAGLVVLALVAIEKCEALACTESAPTVGDLPGALAAAPGAMTPKAGVGDTTASGSSGGAARGSNGTPDYSPGTSNSATNSAHNSACGSSGGAARGSHGTPDYPPGTSNSAPNSAKNSVSNGGSREVRSDGHASDASQRVSD